jgi:16S rRNA (guanine966-N2)-methyltransferase
MLRGTGWSARENLRAPGETARAERAPAPAASCDGEHQPQRRAVNVTRIIAGSRGGRRIAMPRGDRTRPTSDRVREALFSAIAAWAGTAAEPPERALAGLAFCDLYAGSGAVGLEAASRGATRVLLVERDSRTAQLIRQNAEALQLAIEIATTPVRQLLRRSPAQTFDIVFADPPYELESTVVSDQLEQLVTNRWVGARSLIVVERSRRSPDLVWPLATAKRWSRAYGETILSFGSLEPAYGELPEELS